MGVAVVSEVKRVVRDGVELRLAHDEIDNALGAVDAYTPDACAMTLVRGQGYGYPQEMWFTELWLAAAGHLSADEALRVEGTSIRGKFVQYDGHTYELRSLCECRGVWYGRWPD